MSTRSVVVNYVANTGQAQAATAGLAASNKRLAVQSAAASGGVRNAGRSARGAAGGFGLLSPQLLGTAGVVAGLRAAHSASVEFESSAARLQSQIGLTASESGQLADAARRVGTETGRGAQEAVDASFFIASAGLRGQDAMDALEASAQAARIGLGETAGVADLVTSAMNAYGPETLGAADATDILVGAVREGKAEASELAGSMGQVLPVASEMGVTFDQVGAAQAAMTRTGTGAATAAMQLRQILTSLLNPSEGAEQAMRDMGTSSAEVRDIIREDGLFDALMHLRDATGGNEEAMGRLFPNVRALAGVMDLTGANAEDTAQIFENLADSSGNLDDAISVTEQTTRDKLDRISASFEEWKLRVGDATSGVTNAIIDTQMRIGDLSQIMTDADVGGFEQQWMVLRDTYLSNIPVINELGTTQGDLVDHLVDGMVASHDQEAAMRGLTATGERYAGQAAAAAGATGDLDDAMGDLEDQTASTADQLDIINEAFRVLAGVNLDAESAALRVKDGFDDLTDTLEDNGATLDDNTSKGRDNRQAIIDQAEAIWDEIGARHEQGDSLQDIIGTYDDHISTLYDSMIQAGLSEEEAANYIETLGLTPEDLYTEISANWEGARTEWQRVADAIGRIPRNITTTHTTHLREVSTPGSNITARASGGPVNRGGAYLVGEEGPELVTFGQSGMVHPAPQTAQMMSGSGDQSGDSSMMEHHLKQLRRAIERQASVPMVTAANRAERLAS